MIAKRGKELLGLMMIGDGVLSALFPKSHVALWRQGPQSYRDLMDAFLERPGLTRIAGVLEAALGVWLSARQEP